MSKDVLFAAFLTTALPVLAWSQAPIGAEFRVNSYTTGLQARPSVASDSSGAFVIVWHGLGPEGNEINVFGRRYDDDGVPIGGAFRVNSYTTVGQEDPSVALHQNGFVVVYMRTHDDGFGFGVFGRRFDSGGTSQGSEFRIHSHTTGYQGQPSVASDSDGNFVVVWKSAGQDGSGDGIFGQRYDASGVPQGVEFRVNSFTSGHQAGASVASGPGGDFVVAWQSYGQDGSHDGVFGQRYDASGLAQDGEFRVNSYTTSTQSRPAVAWASDGGFVVVWHGVGQDGGASDVFGRRYDASGAALGGEFRVNSYTTAAQSLPAVALDASGNFVVTWQSYSYGSQDGSGLGVFGQLYDSTGAPTGGEFRVNAYTTGHQQLASVASGADGRFVVAWQSGGQDGSDTGVIGRRFAPGIFEDGFESADLSAWSASATGTANHLYAHSAAGLKGTPFGLVGNVESTAGLYVQDDSPHDESHYRVRFYFQTNGFDPGESLFRRRLRLFLAFEENPTRRLAAIVLRRLNGAFSLMGRARLDDNTQYDTGFFPISDDDHFVELAWKRSTGPDANDGSIEMWIDGTSVHAATTLDASISAVDFVRMGALSVKAGADGVLFWDEFESRRQGYIGP